jgi:hypothetical protein
MWLGDKMRFYHWGMLNIVFVITSIFFFLLFRFSCNSTTLFVKNKNSYHSHFQFYYYKFLVLDTLTFSFIITTLTAHVFGHRE